MTRLSVNINKIATLRNARGENLPDILKVAKDIERFGAEGITVHPRPDERHIRYEDVLNLKSIVKTEFNIEGYPSKKFLELIEKVRPHQVTLVPDAKNVITSNSGWDAIKNKIFLKEIVSFIKSLSCRSSIFMNTDLKNIENVKETGTDRIELYTEPYAKGYSKNPQNAVKNFSKASEFAFKLGMEINAGHDLNMSNLKFFKENVKNLKEVSIGHALICESLYYGLENTIQIYLRQLK